MDPEPKSLRPFILVATFFVILGCVATYLYWLVALEESGQTRAPRVFGGSSLYPVAFLPSTSAADRERLTGYVVSMLGPEGGGDPAAAERGLVAAGEAAVPPLLDALHRLSLGTGFESAKARATLGRLERVLAAVAKPLSKEGSPVPPEVPASGGDAADAEAAVKRVEAWFRWWEARRAAAKG